MTAYNFQARFATKVETLEKRQTIRVRGKRRPPHVGERLALYTGMRTARCRKLVDATCASVDPIYIDPVKRTVSILQVRDGAEVWGALHDDDIGALARADGFSNADELFAFFAPQGAVYGHLIKW